MNRDVSPVDVIKDREFLVSTDAHMHFLVAKAKLQDINSWNIATSGSTMQVSLLERSGELLDIPPAKGDYVRLQSGHERALWLIIDDVLDHLSDAHDEYSLLLHSTPDPTDIITAQPAERNEETRVWIILRRSFERVSFECHMRGRSRSSAEHSLLSQLKSDFERLALLLI